ncbi:hypothetical protein A8A01_04825 [Ewingella americana]|nr:hypothetical protein A8A01_04825 [Ewingella americana]
MQVVRDGEIASAEHSPSGKSNGELDEQSANRWAKNPIKPGYNTFKWKFTANHPAAKFEYFITKNGWNPEKQLTRDSFESTPFCTVDGGGIMVNGTATHECQVPAHDGYQIILGVWTVADTTNAFYNVIDVDFGGDNKPGGENHEKPVIDMAKDSYVFKQKDFSEGYTLDASATKYATHYKWEVISGYSHFQLQEKAASKTAKVLEGDTLSAPRAWVAAKHTGKAIYRLTATNAWGEASKDIQVEVTKVSEPGQPGETGSWMTGKSYRFEDVVTYKGKTYRCINAHTSAGNWTPDVAVSLWAEK